MTDHNPAEPDFDNDPAALEWARTKIEFFIARCRKNEATMRVKGQEDGAMRWRVTANHMERQFVGGVGCVIADFDARLPEFNEMVRKARNESN